MQCLSLTWRASAGKQIIYQRPSFSRTYMHTDVSTTHHLEQCVLGIPKWDLILPATLEWACGEGSLILSFCTIHLQSTWLSALYFFLLLFSQLAVCGFPTGSPQSQSVMTAKHSLGRWGVAEEATKRDLQPCHCPRWQLPDRCAHWQK